MRGTYMYDPAIREVEARSQHCATECEWSERSAIRIQFRSGSSVYGTCDTRAKSQICVCTVDYSVNIILIGYIT